MEDDQIGSQMEILSGFAEEFRSCIELGEAPGMEVLFDLSVACASSASSGSLRNKVWYGGRSGLNCKTSLDKP